MASKQDKQTLSEYQSYLEANTALFNMVSSPFTTQKIDVYKTAEGMAAVSNFASNVDKLGKAIKYGTPCPVCGKNMKHIPPGGYCSTDCFLKDIMNRVKNHTVKENDFIKLVEQIQRTLQLLDVALNLLAELPQKVTGLASLPPYYKNYLQIRINMVFMTIKITINKILIIKNKLLIKILRPLQYGVMLDELCKRLPIIKTIIETTGKLFKVLDTTYSFVLSYLKSPTFGLPGESYVWAATPRSIVTKPGLFYVEVPKSGSLTSISPLNGGLTALKVDKISELVRNLFPPIIPAEYLMPPKAFEVRLALSNKSDIVKQFITVLETFLKAGPEYMPRYKDLSLKNPFFILAILIAWGPTAKEMFGSFIQPYA